MDNELASPLQRINHNNHSLETVIGTIIQYILSRTALTQTTNIIITADRTQWKKVQ